MSHAAEATSAPLPCSCLRAELSFAQTWPTAMWCLCVQEIGSRLPNTKLELYTRFGNPSFPKHLVRGKPGKGGRASGVFHIHLLLLPQSNLTFGQVPEP